MEQLLTQFLEHLRYERNVSEHTSRNYQSDLEQFLDYLAPAHAKTGKRSAPALAAIDHITIREWLSTLHTAQKKKAAPFVFHDLNRTAAASETAHLHYVDNVK